MRIRGHRLPPALLIVLALGVIVRVALVLSYTPAYLSYPDTWGYVKAASGPLFMDDWFRPAGYPALLAALHAVWASLTFVVTVQHVLGLLTAVLLYATLRRLGAPVWVALVPAAVAALSLDLVYFEHTLLSETVFTTLFASALYAAARSLSASRAATASAWAAGAGVAMAAGIVTRPAGLFAVPVMALALLLAAGTWRARLSRAAVLTVVVMAGVLSYAAVNQAETGTFGLTEGGGWAVYSRAAPFADCRTFTPPEGTAMLCESSDARTRGGPDFYSWYTGSVARRFFVGPPYNEDRVGEFGSAAIRAQPKAYLSAVATDLWRYVDTDAGRDRVGNGAGPDGLTLDRRDPAAEALNRSVSAPYYGRYSITTRGLAGTLADLQAILRVHGVLVLVAVLLSLLALPVASRAERVAILLLGGSAVLAIGMATATTVYNWRYAVPFLPVLMASGALGLHVLAIRVRAVVRRPRRARAAA